MTILEAAQMILESATGPLSPNKMWDIAVKNGLDKKLNLSGKTPWASFGAGVYVNAKRANSPFEIVQKKPVLVKLKGREFAKNAKITEHRSKSLFCERDLHPLLAKFLYSNENFDAFCKTIFHENSKKSVFGTDKWLYPDIVAVSFEYANLDVSTLEFIDKKVANSQIKIYSFEMKKEINIGNFREYFFQAVSNSSWANEGYLVALNIDESDTELGELMRKTSQAFGIGIISLDSENIAESKVLCRAKFNDKLDLFAIDELSRKNSGFADFIATITQFNHKNWRKFSGEFDEIMEDDEFAEYLKNKKII